MRHLLIISLLTALSGCAAPVPSDAAPTHGPTGKADGVCYFGSTIEDIVASGRFVVVDEAELTADSELSDDDLDQLLAGMPPSVSTLSAMADWVDDGAVLRRTFEDPADPDAGAFALFTYGVEGDQGGFITRESGTDVLAHLVDGEIGACRVDARVPVDGGACLFGGTIDDLMSGFFSGDFEYIDEQALTVDSELTREQADQLQAMIPVGGGGVEVLFGQTDNGEIEVGTLLSTTTDHAPFTFYSYDQGGARMGFIYAAGTVERVAVLDDGVWVDCSTAPAVTPAPPGGGACLFGDTVDDLMSGFFSGAFEYNDDQTLTVDSALTDEHADQLQAMIPVGGGGVEVLFARSDNGEIEVGTLVSTTTDHDAFTFYSYDEGGAQTGFVYVAGSLERVAMLAGGVWTDCTVSP